MIAKAPILPSRVRKTPRSFSWIDHRLVRERHIDRCTHSQSALYLFLVCVADSQGLSYYGDKAIMDRLCMDSDCLKTARSGLIQNGLIAWQKPIYQVVGLDPVPEKSKRHSTMMRLSDILKAAAEGNHD